MFRFRRIDHVSDLDCSTRDFCCSFSNSFRREISRYIFPSQVDPSSPYRTGGVMYLCPNCQFRVQDFEQLCPSCDADVTQIGILNEIPDRLFNEALRAVEQNDLITASTKCNAALHQRPRDPELWMLLGIVYARMAAFVPAQQCFQTVTFFDTSYQPAKEFLTRVNALITSTQSDTSN